VPEALNKDMREFLETLNRSEVKYLLVGAHAVNAYTEPRSTKDLDVWVKPSLENGNRVFAALAEFGAGRLEGVTPEYFAKPGNFFQIGQAPSRIDVLNSIQGVEFDSCWDKRRTLSLHGISVPILSAPDLLAAKLATGRHQDLADAEKLKAAIELEQRHVRRTHARGPEVQATEQPNEQRPSRPADQQHQEAMKQLREFVERPEVKPQEPTPKQDHKQEQDQKHKRERKQKRTQTHEPEHER
jgi:hypothetical protein